MVGRSRSKTLMFNKLFLLQGVDRVLPEGDYQVVTEEELMEEISFPVYRRVATVIFVPAPAHGAFSIIEITTIDPLDLHAALDRDAVQ
jgi:hypothetical protein